MPVIDGFYLCKTIKPNNELSEIPIIFITSAFDSITLNKSFQYFNIDCIIKQIFNLKAQAQVKIYIN